MATEYAEVEVWVVVDGPGDYGVGKDEEAATENYREDIGDSAGPMRVVKMTLKVPLPKIMEVTGTVPEDAEGEIALAVG